MNRTEIPPLPLELGILPRSSAGVIWNTCWGRNLVGSSLRAARQ